MQDSSKMQAQLKESCSTTPKEVFKHQTILHSLQELPAT
jgi:hypothetical protein